MNPVKILIDVVGGAALVFVLLLVLIVDLLTRTSPVPPSKNNLEVREITNVRVTGDAPKKLRMAVLTDPVEIRDVNTGNVVRTDVWDDMSKLLTKLGSGYQHDQIRTKDLRDNPSRLDDIDVLFFTCSDDKGKHELTDQLQKFVGRGGILYASDWRFDAVAAAFPDVVDASKKGEGVKGKVTADVVDAGLRDALRSKSIELNFDLPQWKTAAFGGPRVTVLMHGTYKKMRSNFDQEGAPASAPLLVKFPFGKGQVIFTSFHNEKNSGPMEDKLLQYLVFAMVVAKAESQLQEQVNQGGFSPQRSNLLSTPQKNQSETKTFQVKHAGPLRIALSFNEGARLKLYLKAPDGKDWSKEFTAAAALEVPQAQAGEWTYTITALDLPHENFPFSVSIYEKK